MLEKMPNRDILKEEILEVFKVFDEDDSGVISILEFCRALYAILGERIPRSEVVRLVAEAKHQRRFEEAIAKDVKAVVSAGEEDDSGLNLSGGNSGVVSARSVTMSPTSVLSNMQWPEEGESINVTPEIFERVVLAKLNARSYADKLQTTFGLLEDKLYPGFITRESLVNAAAEIDEPLTDMEIAEMFDPLVTGVPTAAVDFETFSNIQHAAQNVCNK